MKKIVESAVAAMEDKKGENIVVIDLTTIDGSITDYFVICEAQSTTQVDAISDEVEKQLIEGLKEKPHRVEGKDNGLWVAMDYGDIIVHVFERETRQFYNLEDLWSDAPQFVIESKE